MKFLYIIFQFILLLCITRSDNIPRLWLRIPHYNVNYRVIDFLNNNQINNCFEYMETQTHLKLKCWRENGLINIDIKVNDYTVNDKIYLQVEPYESILV